MTDWEKLQRWIVGIIVASAIFGFGVVFGLVIAL
jgi:hypothetical protein